MKKEINIKEYNETYSHPYGKPYAGKTELIEANILQDNSSFVVEDPDGRIFESTGEFLKSQGYEVKALNLVQMKNSHTYNPFYYINDEEGVISMINSLIINTNPKYSTGDSFLVKGETALLYALCFYLYYEYPIEERHFTNIMKLLQCGEILESDECLASPLDKLFIELERKSPEHIAVSQYKTFKHIAGNTWKSILLSCSVRLASFNIQDVANLTSTDNIDLLSVGKKKTAIFCITSPMDSSFDFLVALFYAQLFRSLGKNTFHEACEENNQPPAPVRFLLGQLLAFKW